MHEISMILLYCTHKAQSRAFFKVNLSGALFVLCLENQKPNVSCMKRSVSISLLTFRAGLNDVLELYTPPLRRFSSSCIGCGPCTATPPRYLDCEMSGFCGEWNRVYKDSSKNPKKKQKPYTGPKRLLVPFGLRGMSTVRGAISACGRKNRNLNTQGPPKLDQSTLRSAAITPLSLVL